MASNNNVIHSAGGSSLGDILEKILDKGVVIAGDISIALADVELLTIKIRLVVASVEKAMEMGINWWQSDPALCSKANNQEQLNNPDYPSRTDDQRRLNNQTNYIPSALNDQQQLYGSESVNQPEPDNQKKGRTYSRLSKTNQHNI